MDDTRGSALISATTSTKEDRTLAGTILGTTDAGRILENLRALCGQCKQSPPVCHQVRAKPVPAEILFSFEEDLGEGGWLKAIRLEDYAPRRLP